MYEDLIYIRFGEIPKNERSKKSFKTLLVFNLLEAYFNLLDIYIIINSLDFIGK